MCSFTPSGFTTTYVDPKYRSIDDVWLCNEEYARALQAFVIACVDIMYIDRQTRRIYLATRKAKPVSGLWWIGGRMKVNERREETAVRCIERELGIELNPARLVYVGALDFLCSDRQQEPQNVGCHTMSFLYCVQIESGELQSMKLDPDEYDVGYGLRPFTREELVFADVRSNILEAFDYIFQPE